MRDFTVVTSIYKNDNPDFVRIALDSMLVFQTETPTEIILVQDGPVSVALTEQIAEYEEKYASIMRVIRLSENAGLGNALRIGVEHASNHYIARMDSDDICEEKRFELQLDYLDAHEDVDIVGGQMTEFIDDPKNIVARRCVPLNNDDIYDMMKSRCALNHVTVMFRRDSILKSGNYQDWYCNEDYYLWVRMMKNACVFANLREVLVNVRTGISQYGRRGGKRYFNSEKAIKKLMLDQGLIARREYFVNVAIRYVVQVMMPASLRGWILRHFARSKN